MNGDQFNELLAYMKIVALNTTALLFQQSRETPLSPDEIAHCQSGLLKTAEGLINLSQPVLWPPSSGKADA